MTDRPVALVTGATGDLGKVLVADLDVAGYDLALVSSDADRIRAVANEIGLADDRYHGIAADLRDAEATRAAIDEAYRRFGRVDALAHLVGGWTGGVSVADSDDEPFSSMIDQHLWTPLNVVRAVSPRMVAAGRGRIVAVSSPMAVRPTKGMSAYAVGKAALEALLKTLASEVAGSGVTVNVVRVRTIDAGHERDTDPALSNVDWTTPAEISSAIRYLFTDAAGVVNGEAIGLHGTR